MRTNAGITCYTDYPFLESDVSGKEAPIRKVKLISWDGNKYGDVVYNGEVYNFKVWYLYDKYARLSLDGPRPVTTRVRKWLKKNTPDKIYYRNNKRFLKKLNRIYVARR